jgi:hypothetical protein
MISGYLDAATAAQWKAEFKPKLFATSKQLGNVQAITFHHDNDDGSDHAVGPYDVLVVLASGGAPQIGAGQSVAYVGVSGEFRKEAPFAVARGDRFCLTSGACGTITTAPIADIAFIRAPFVIER